jgi:hypothetical protein
MAIQLQLRRGTTTEHNTFTGAVGELTYDTTNKTLRVHDGSTVGGIRLATLTGGSVPLSQLPNATTTTKGTVILNDTLTSTSATQALTARQGNVLWSRDFGIDQYWTDVTAWRAKNVTYTNNTGKAILVNVCVMCTDDVDGMTVTVGGVRVGFSAGYQSSGTGGWYNTITFIVPNLTSYVVSGDSSLIFWVELR